jgi:hypothetical protein
METLADFGRSREAISTIDARLKHGGAETKIVCGAIGIATWTRKDGKVILVTYCADAGAQGTIEIGDAEKVVAEINRIIRETKEVSACSSCENYDCESNTYEE